MPDMLTYTPDTDNGFKSRHNIGRPAPRIDAQRRATGEQKFLSDITLSGAVWAAVVRSPFPRANVKSIDTRPALDCPGVIAAFTARDVPDTLFNSGGSEVNEDLAITAYRRLLTDNAQHVGDGVAVIVAHTASQAASAARAVQVDWEVITPILDPEEAYARGEIFCTLSSGEGEVERALASADLIITGRYSTPAVQHVCLEPHCCAAWVDPLDGRLVIWSNTQVPADIRRLCASILGIPLARIRMRKITEGGGFGSKQELHAEALLAWLAQKLDRPVQLNYSRTEEFTASRGRHSSVVNVRLGFRNDGILLGCDIHAILNSGGYASHARYVLEDLGAAPPYLYPSAVHRFQGTVVRTNTLPGGAYRGYGVPQALFPLEQAMDEAAHRLNIDPVDLRRLNSIGTAQLGRCLDAGASAFGWANSDSTIGQDGLIRAAGMAIASTEAHKATSSATVRWNEDGTVTLITGTCDSSTGTSTVLAQIVSDELGLPLNAISVLEGDTDTGLVDLGSYSSRTVFVGGGAARQAAIAALERLLDVAAIKLKRRRDTLALQNGCLVDRFDAAFSKALADFCRDYIPGGNIIATASYTPDISVLSYGACFVTVAVDPGTGEIRVERCVSAVDCGRVLNPLGAAGQVHGGVVQGIGFALFEKWAPGADGLGPRSIAEHGLPTALDAPSIEAVFVNAREPAGPYGAKGLGEIPLVAVAPAIANAVARAIGARLNRLPLRREDVWRAIQARAEECTPVRVSA